MTSSSNNLILKKRKRKDKTSEKKIKTFKTKATVYHHVLQRSEEWHLLRKGRISGSQSGTAAGMSKYCNVRDYFLEQIQPDLVFVTNKFCEHGVYTEPFSVDVIKHHIFPNLHKHFAIMRQNKTMFDVPSPELVIAWKDQVYSEEPGYQTPNPEHNENFPLPEDADLFGLSLDMEGSLIDIEIKNPYIPASLWKNYYRSFSPLYFAQVQWSMAMRCRNSMFLIATSYTHDKPPKLVAYVVWFVKFSKEFFDMFLYPSVKLMSQTIRKKNPDDITMLETNIPYLEEDGNFETSHVYKFFFDLCCTRVCTEKFV